MLPNGMAFSLGELVAPISREGKVTTQLVFEVTVTSFRLYRREVRSRLAGEGLPVRKMFCRP